MIYYVDPNNGNNLNDGLSEENPLLNIDDVTLKPGDTVLYKRGTVLNKALFLQDGNEDGFITYSAYGEGDNPVINPSLDASAPELWKELRKGVWQFTGTLPREMCNIVFNDGEKFGNLRWSQEELSEDREWYYTMLGHSMNDYNWDKWAKGTLYLACHANPAEVFEKIELVHWGQRQAIGANRYVKIENFTFEKSGVHGFASRECDHIEIRHCKFRCIGGGVFDLPTRVRLGNAIEFWNGATDCYVEHCIFEDIYDSGITHQGLLPESWVPERLYFRNNIFIRCGMAAYECRGPASRDIYFENNLCLQAGGEFTLQGEEPPRRTEIPFAPATCVYVLIWRMEQGIPFSEKYCTIRNNIFCNAPMYGASLSTGMDDKFMKQFVIENNTYVQSDDAPIVRTEHGVYTAKDFERYKKENGFDITSKVLTERI